MPTPIRLLVVTARYPSPDRPAAGAFVRDRLVGVEARVIAPDRFDLPGWRRYGSLAWRALTARGRFDGVEGHFLLPTGPLAVIAARLRRLPCVIYVHGGDVRDTAGRTRAHAALARWTLRAADAVVTNSEDSAARIRALGREPQVVPPGIDLGRFRPQPAPERRRVLYLGGAVEHKGVAIARQLADTLVGPGIDEVPPEEVPRLLAEHSVVLVPSLEEPYGLVAAEGIAAGRWVVARDVGGLREIVTPGVNGTLVADGDFAGALAAVPDYDPAAVAASAQRFDVERHRTGLAALWRRVLGARGR
jgi:glycosyltransferase involved in cell wall biosynthesis